MSKEEEKTNDTNFTLDIFNISKEEDLIEVDFDENMEMTLTTIGRRC